MLDRNIATKLAPERWQDCTAVFDVAVTFESRVMEALCDGESVLLCVGGGGAESSSCTCIARGRTKAREMPTHPPTCPLIPRTRRATIITSKYTRRYELSRQQDQSAAARPQLGAGGGHGGFFVMREACDA